MKKTVLCEIHKSSNAKMVDFSGWFMPVQYTNVMDEHKTTRTKAGLFDICHMGEFIISGPKAKEFLQNLCLNDIKTLTINKAQYSMFCNEKGGVIDDIFIYQLEENKYMIVTNAGTIEKDYRWMQKNITKIKENTDLNPEDIRIENISKETAKLDLQGPLSEEILQKICKTNLKDLQRFHFIDTKVNDIDCKVSRTGYTAEDGFELYFKAENAKDIWKKLIEIGKPLGLRPIGLGARDTLRLEACYSLYGHELDENTTPIEASLGWLVKDKKNFVGSDIILRQKSQTKKMEKINIAFEMVDKSIPREHYEVQKDGKKIGEVSSGTFSPTFKKGLGMAFVKPEFSEPNTEIEIIVREKSYKAKVVKKPFYNFNKQ